MTVERCDATSLVMRSSLSIARAVLQPQVEVLDLASLVRQADDIRSGDESCSGLARYDEAGLLKDQ